MLTATPAVGNFTRLEAIADEPTDLYSYSFAHAEVDLGYPDVDDDDTFYSDLVAPTSAIAENSGTLIDVGEANVSAVAHSLSEIVTPINSTVIIPVVTQVAAQLTSVDATNYDGLGLVYALGEAYTETGLVGAFEYNDPTPLVPKNFWGGIHIVAVGDALAIGDGESYFDATGNSTGSIDEIFDNVATDGMAIQVWKNNVLLADLHVAGQSGAQRDFVFTFDQNEWVLEGQMVDINGDLQPVYVHSDGLNVFLAFLTPIQDGDVITFDSQYNGSALDPGISSDQLSYSRKYDEGHDFTSGNFAEAINAYGFAFDAGDPPPPIGIIGGPGGGPGGGGPGGDPGGGAGGAPGDLDGDGDIDNDDAQIWVQVLSDWAGPDGHAPLVVTTESDIENGNYTYGDLSLREAIALASTVDYPDQDYITFAPWLDHITLGDELEADSDVKIVGAGVDKLTIDTDGGSRIFHIDSGVDTEIRGLTITGGTVNASSPGGNLGGGVYNVGDLALRDVAIVSNQTDYTNLSGANAGGGVYSSGGSLQVIDSTIDGNRSRYGGGVSASVGNNKTFEITGSTISNNAALSSSNDGAGGGLYLVGPSTSPATILNLTNTTISGNRASDGAAVYVGSSTTALKFTNDTIASNVTKTLTGTAISGGLGGGISNFSGGSVTLYNTLIAANVASNTAWHAGAGSFAGSGSSYNLIDITHSGIGLTNGTANNQIGSGTALDAKLAPLSDYGGKTKTHALKLTSPALEAASDSLAPASDQRGEERPVAVSGVSDIGAFEAGDFTVLTVRTEIDSTASPINPNTLSLRDALALSADLAGSETIRFDSSVWDEVIVLASGELEVASDVNIIGPGVGRLTIDADGDGRIFDVHSGAKTTISGMTITGGSVTASSSHGNVGGGVYNDGDLVLKEVAIASNVTDYTNLSGANAGGGVYSTVNASLKIIDSTIDGNRSRYGGGVSASVGNNKTFEITGSTISNNAALSSSNDGAGGGLFVSGPSTSPATVLTITNSTISGNRASDGAGVYVGSSTTALKLINDTIAKNVTKTLSGTAISGGLGGGISNFSGGSVTLYNTLIAANVATNTAWHAGAGSFAGAGSSYNLIDITHSGIGLSNGTAGNLIGSGTAIDAKLAPLANYGGKTKTHALLYNSPAIDAGEDSYATSIDLAFDQRGRDRIVDWDNDSGADNIDIGAVEVALTEYFT